MSFLAYRVASRTVESVNVYEHEHPDGSIHPGKGSPKFFGDWGGPWDCDECRDHYWQHRDRARSKTYADKNIGIAISGLKLERERDHGGVREGTLAGDRLREERVAATAEQIGGKAFKPKGMDLPDAFKAALQITEHKKNLTGPTKTKKKRKRNV